MLSKESWLFLDTFVPMHTAHCFSVMCSQREAPFLSFCLKLKATSFQKSCMTSVLQPLLVCVIKLYQTNERDKSIWITCCL